MSDAKDTETETKTNGSKTDTDTELPVIYFPMKTYKGVVMYNNEIEKIEQMEIRDDDVWACSFPRSGTTLTQELTYLIATGDFETAETVQLDDRFPIIDVKDDRFPFYRGLKHIEQMKSQRFVKSHFHYFLLPEQLRGGKGKIIYTTRNPKDSIYSLYKLLLWFRQFDGMQEPFETFFEMFMKGEGMYAGPWWTHVREYWEHRNDKNLLFLKFEDVSKDLSGAIRKIADFLGKKLTSNDVSKIATHCSLENMRNNDKLNMSYQRSLRAIDDSLGGFINKGMVGGWKDVLTDEMSKRVDEMFTREFTGTGLTFV